MGAVQLLPLERAPAGFDHIDATPLDPRGVFAAIRRGMLAQAERFVSELP